MKFRYFFRFDNTVVVHGTHAQVKSDFYLRRLIKKSEWLDESCNGQYVQG